MNFSVSIEIKRPVDLIAILAASDAADAETKGREHARLLLSNDVNRESAIVQTFRTCAACGGDGLKPKRKYTRAERGAWPPPSCGECTGRGTIILAEFEMTRADAQTEPTV